jgi:hypothetical protein
VIKPSRPMRCAATIRVLHRGRLLQQPGSQLHEVDRPTPFELGFGETLEYLAIVKFIAAASKRHVAEQPKPRRPQSKRGKRFGALRLGTRHHSHRTNCTAAVLCCSFHRHREAVTHRFRPCIGPGELHQSGSRWPSAETCGIRERVR